MRADYTSTGASADRFMSDGQIGALNGRILRLVFMVGRAVRTDSLRCPASLSGRPRLRVAAFGVYASPLCDLGLGCPELGYVALAELSSVRGKLSLPV